MAYTYLLKFKPTNKYYYGVRFAKNCSPKELFKSYFSSSAEVKLLIEKHGIDAFDYEVRQIFDYPNDAVLWEQKFLTKVNAAKSENWLNKSANPFSCSQVFSEETIKKRTEKMLKTRMKNGSYKNQKKKDTSYVTTEYREYCSSRQKGKSNKKISRLEESEIASILELYKSKPNLAQYEEQFKTKSGKYKSGKAPSYDRLFAKWVVKYMNLKRTPENVFKIVKGETVIWNYLYEKILMG